MAHERNPDDPYRSPKDPYRSPLAGEEIQRQARLDNELQVDPELAEGPASGGRIAMFATLLLVSARLTLTPLPLGSWCSPVAR